jgi:hypothetical protein
LGKRLKYKKIQADEMKYVLWRKSFEWKIIDYHSRHWKLILFGAEEEARPSPSMNEDIMELITCLRKT